MAAAFDPNPRAKISGPSVAKAGEGLIVATSIAAEHVARIKMTVQRTLTILAAHLI
jgi:hypothetical protein